MLLVGLALLISIISLLVINRDIISIDSLKRMFLYRDSYTEAFTYSDDKNNSCAALGDGLLVASESGFEFYDKSGETAISDEFTMTSPSAVSAGNRAMVYDVGGRSLRVLDEQEIIFEIESDYAIISAQINENGWVALSSEETGAKGLVTVYNSQGKAVYEWHSRTGYLISAAVSPDNMRIAALTMTGDGTRIVFFDLDSKDEQGAYPAEGELFYSIMYTSGGQVLAVSEDKVIYLDGDGALTGGYAYETAYLRALAFDGALALYLGDTGSGSAGRLVLLDETGELLGEAETDREILSVSMCGKYLGVLYSDGLDIYRGDLTLYNETSDTVGADSVLMRADGTTLLVKSYQTTVYIP